MPFDGSGRSKTPMGIKNVVKTFDGSPLENWRPEQWGIAWVLVGFILETFCLRDHGAMAHMNFYFFLPTNWVDLPPLKSAG
jgi:hypothetical protein